MTHIYTTVAITFLHAKVNIKYIFINYRKKPLGLLPLRRSYFLLYPSRKRLKFG